MGDRTLPCGMPALILRWLLWTCWYVVVAFLPFRKLEMNLILVWLVGVFKGFLRRMWWLIVSKVF